MLAQIIYTRCSNGRDLFKDGQVKIGSGFKAFSFSRELLAENFADIAFIEDTIKKDLPYNKRDAVKKEVSYVQSEEEFTDDAFLYFVPDFGVPFIMNFSVRIYVQGASDRPGNFINQAFAGQLTDKSGRLCYPCSFFHSDSFDAKLFEESAYYQYKGSEVPDYLNRVDGLEPNPDYSFERAGEFIRQEDRAVLLQKAVWFILKQFELPAEQRKYIVIKGLESEIEMWIAAINYAFSPDIAQQIPFATRMNRSTVENKYNISPDGKFSKNPGASVRYRAMIVGVDIRDAAGMRDLRPIPNSPYVLLEEIQADAYELNKRYFDLISQFDEIHRQFVFDFLRLDGNNVSLDTVLRSCSVFFKLYYYNAAEMKFNDTVKILQFIHHNKIVNIPNWEMVKRSALDNLENCSEGLEAAMLITEIDKTRGITDDDFMGPLCDYSVHKIIVMANVNSKNYVNKDLPGYWKQTEKMFKNTEYHRILCEGIIDTASKEICYAAFNKLQPYETAQTIMPFLDIYVSCMCVCGVNFDDRRTLDFVAETLTALLRTGPEYNNLVIEILNKIRENIAGGISALRGFRGFQDSRLSDFIRRYFGNEIVPVKTADDLISVCRQRMLDHMNEDDLEYFLADYYNAGSFPAETLINKVLATFVLGIEQEAKKKVLPFPCGQNFFDKCIEQHAGDYKFTELLNDIMSARIMLDAKTQESLLRSVDNKLARFLNDKNFNAIDYAANTPQVQSAEKMLKISEKRFDNSCLIVFFSKLVNKQAVLKTLTEFAGNPIRLPNSDYGSAVISAVSKTDFTTEQHLAVMLTFCRDFNDLVTIDFTYKYLDSILDPSKAKLFAEMNRFLTGSPSKGKNSGVKLFEDIFGEKYSTSSEFAVMVCFFKQELKKIYKEKLAEDREFAGSLKRIIDKDENLSEFCKEVYGFDDGARFGVGARSEKDTAYSSPKWQECTGSGLPVNDTRIPSDISNNCCDGDDFSSLDEKYNELVQQKSNKGTNRKGDPQKQTGKKHVLFEKIGDIIQTVKKNKR